MSTVTTSQPTLADRLRREWYLLRFSWAMQDYPRRQYKQVRADLRDQITIAAGDVGMARAVEDLGHPRALAERYVAELGRRLPRWTTGAVAAGLTVHLVVYLGMAYALGTHDTLDALGGGSVTTYPFGAETTFTHTDDEISLESSASVAGTVFVVSLASVAFALGARVWRVFR